MKILQCSMLSVFLYIFFLYQLHKLPLSELQFNPVIIPSLKCFLKRKFLSFKCVFFFLHLHCYSGKYKVKYDDGLKKTLHEHHVSNVHKVLNKLSLNCFMFNTYNIDKDNNILPKTCHKLFLVYKLCIVELKPNTV